MHKTIIALGFIITGAYVVNAIEPVVDFDGKNKDTKGIETLLGENPPVFTGPLTRNEPIPVGEQRFGTLNEKGEFIEAEPVESWLNEEGIRVNRYTFLPGTKIYNQQACNWQNSGQWSARVDYFYYADLYGGHNHATPSPPALKISHSSVNNPPDGTFESAPSPITVPPTPVNTPYKYWIQLPEFATRLYFQVQAYGSCAGQQQSSILDVKVDGLVKMAPPSGPGYILYNSPDPAHPHPEKHYGTKEFIDTLKAIGKDYKTACPTAKPLQINAISLPWGGLFDIRANWGTPHVMHRKGENADIRKIKVKAKNRAKLIEIMCKHVANKKVYSEGNEENEEPHYHLGPKGIYDTLIWDVPSEENDAKIINCCTTPVPNECLKLQTNGADDTDQTANQPSDCQ